MNTLSKSARTKALETEMLFLYQLANTDDQTNALFDDLFLETGNEYGFKVNWLYEALRQSEWQCERGKMGKCEAAIHAAVHNYYVELRNREWTKTDLQRIALVKDIDTASKRLYEHLSNLDEVDRKAIVGRATPSLDVLYKKIGLVDVMPSSDTTVRNIHLASRRWLEKSESSAPEKQQGGAMDREIYLTFSQDLASIYLSVIGDKPRCYKAKGAGSQDCVTPFCMFVRNICNCTGIDYKQKPLIENCSKWDKDDLKKRTVSAKKIIPPELPLK